MKKLYYLKFEQNNEDIKINNSIEKNARKKDFNSCIIS